MCGKCADNSKLAKYNSKLTAHHASQFSVHEQAALSVKPVSKYRKVHGETLSEKASFLTCTTTLRVVGASLGN